LDIELVKGFYAVKDKNDFYEFFDSYCIRKFATEGTAEGTQKHYDLTRRKLFKFKKQIQFKDITLNFIEKFDKFVRVNLNSGVHGTFSCHKNLKTVLIAAHKTGLLKYNPYLDFKTR